jgi:glucose/arabinose dehydrogenase
MPSRHSSRAFVLIAFSAVAVLGAQNAPTRPSASDQSPRVIPRPPAADSRASAAAGSTAPDGYAPIPEWAGQTRAPKTERTAAFAVDTVVSGITGGFSFHFLPDRRILLSERPGRLRIAAADGTLSEPLAGLPQMFAGGPQGLFEALPDREFASNRLIYFGYTALPEGPRPSPLPRLAGVLMIARARLSSDDRRLEDVRVLLNAEGINGRIRQAPDGTLLVTSGIPAGVGIHSPDWPQPQDLTSRMGKVLRINTDGSVPADNPFAGREGALPEIYAYGLRDDQGMAIHPATGKLWTSENGPRGGDEINAIDPGRNYGFPVISYGREYSGKPINGDRTSQPGMEQPIYFWTPSVAPSGMTFYTGALFPAWQGNLFVAALAGKHVARLVLDGQRVIGEERLLADLDTRMRDVREGPDGALYVMTDGEAGKILRLRPPR